MRRKIIKQGVGGSTIFLPAKWVRSNDLKPGDEVDVAEDGSKLIVSGHGTAEKRSIDIVVPTGRKQIIRSMISNTYKKGYDVINVRCEQADLKLIESAVQNLMGYEIIDVTAKGVTIKNVSEGLEAEYSNLFRKSFFLCKENIRKMREDINKGSYDRSAEVQEYRDLVTKYTDYCKRLLIKLKRNEDFAIFEYMVLWTVEKTSNELNYIYRYLAKARPKVNKVTFGNLDAAFTMFENLVTSYFKETTDYIQKFTKEKDKFMYEDLPALSARKDVDHYLLHCAANIVRRCHDMTGPFYGRFL
ncbi:MAG: hypothetical protein ABIA62_05055 [Candidatus Woesearchaeota archaeon]